MIENLYKHINLLFNIQGIPHLGVFRFSKQKQQWCKRELGDKVPVIISFASEKKNYAFGNILIDVRLRH